MKLPEIVILTTYPPRECGIATYSQDLAKALNIQFGNSYNITVGAIENEVTTLNYNNQVKYKLNANNTLSYGKLTKQLNNNDDIALILIQHEFGLFKTCETEFNNFLQLLNKPFIICFHTVLPNPNDALLLQVRAITLHAKSIVVMTNTSAKILANSYTIAEDKIKVIPHGTHLISHGDKALLKLKYGFSRLKILTTFGLLSSGKSIETTLYALPSIIATNNEVLFLIIGKTHPAIVANEGETYRLYLQNIITNLKLENNVKFINNYLPLPDLLEYLQMTDVYLFTSKDPQQAVSGTFAYALSCGCAIVSTPIPHALEVLKNDTGIIIDFENSVQLTTAVKKLLGNKSLRKLISINGVHTISPTAWENAAIKHASLFAEYSNVTLKLKYKIPDINWRHMNKLTTKFGMIQFSKINEPDIESGYTLDDNARALVATCQYIELYGSKQGLQKIKVYLNFIMFCFQAEGNFLNYVDKHKNFTSQNNETNLEDSNGRAIWALGYLISLQKYIPHDLISTAIKLLESAIPHIETFHSTRAMAFAIKGLYYANTTYPDTNKLLVINKLSNRLVQMYKHETDTNWHWCESYLTYGNSIIPEALLCAYIATNDIRYKNIAETSFHFLLSKIFINSKIKVISNKGWLYKINTSLQEVVGGEQAIDVAYTVMALHKFYDCIKKEDYNKKMEIAFSWFLGNNHLQQIMYNPCTGGCYDGLETDYVNLNQGAESTVSYFMARLTIEKNNLQLKAVQNNTVTINQKKTYTLTQQFESVS